MARPQLGLTHKQRECLEFITRYINEHKVSPSLDDICTALGLRSKAGVSRLTAALQERGYITLMRGRARSIALLRDGYDEPYAQAGLFRLPPSIHAALMSFCDATGEEAADVVSDAVALHIDIVEQCKQAARQ